MCALISLSSLDRKPISDCYLQFHKRHFFFTKRHPRVVDRVNPIKKKLLFVAVTFVRKSLELRREMCHWTISWLKKVVFRCRIWVGHDVSSRGSLEGLVDRFWGLLVVVDGGIQWWWQRCGGFWWLSAFWGCFKATNQKEDTGWWVTKYGGWRVAVGRGRGGDRWPMAGCGRKTEKDKRDRERVGCEGERDGLPSPI